MKKKLLFVCLILAFIMITAGCSKEEESDDTKKQSEQQEEENLAVVTPLPVTIDAKKLQDCTVAVSLEEGDVSEDASGNVQMQVKVYTYDLYDMMDMNQLAEGSVIRIGGEDIEVTSVEQGEKSIIINGGLDVGGYEFCTDDDTVYYQIDYSDVLFYYEIGEVTLPVAEDFVYVDASDLDKGEVTYTLSGFMKQDSGIEYHFIPNNTKIVIEGGEVVAMERIYMP